MVVKGLSFCWVSIKAIVCTKTFAIVDYRGLIILVIGGGIVYWIYTRGSRRSDIKAVSDGETASNSDVDFNENAI